jgi:hypothetical protein
MLRKFSVLVAVTAMLIAVPAQSKAADLPIKAVSTCGSAPGAPILLSWQGLYLLGTFSCLPSHAARGAVSVTGSVAFGFLGVVAGLCAYDIYLKVKGVKNWDGTANVVEPHKHRYHTA